MVSKELSVLVLFGTRPELIKLAPVIRRLQEEGSFAVSTVSTSQHRELLADLLPLFEIEPDFDLDVLRPDQTPADVSRRTLAGLDPILGDLQPDLLLVQGDTTSAFAGALAAFYSQVPVGHVEAGLRSFDDRHPYPEEMNRRLITSLARLHFAPLESNERNLLAEGVEPSRVFVTGNTGIDALLDVDARKTGALDAFVPGEALAGRRMVLVTAHRRESFDGHLAELCHALQELIANYPDLLVVYPVHPNPNVRRAVLPALGDSERILLLDPLPYPAFVEAMAKAHLIVTDSGGVQEEAPALGKPVLVFRKVTERNEGVAAQGARLVGLGRSGLVAEASSLLDDGEAYRQMSEHRTVYGDGAASERVVQGILHHFRGGERPERFSAPASARVGGG